MSKWKVISLVLIIGLGIGCIVPAATFWWANKNQAHFALNDLDEVQSFIDTAQESLLIE